MTADRKAPRKRRLTMHRGVPRHPGWGRPFVVMGIGLVILLCAGLVFSLAIRAYHDRVALAGKSSDVSPVTFSIAGETLTAPANTLRYASQREGGEVESVDLLLTWPGLEGLTAESADAFRDGSALAPLIRVTVAPRDNRLESDGRLTQIYAPFFAGDPVEGPSGLVGRYMTADSGYGAEMIFHSGGAPPFTARCVRDATDEVPATCMRDVDIGSGLSMLYRFNRFYLGDWAEMDRELRARIESYLAGP